MCGKKVGVLETGMVLTLDFCHVSEVNFDSSKPELYRVRKCS